MPRRRTTLLLTALALLALATYPAYTRYRNYNDYDALFINCHSDKLCVLASAISAATRPTTQPTTLPSKTTILDSLDPKARPWFLTCSGSKQPFIWNDQAFNSPALATSKQIPLLWCPHHSHGQYTGVILYKNNKVTYTILTQIELKALLH